MAGDAVQNLVVHGNMLLLCFGTSLEAVQTSSGNTIWQRDTQVQSWYLDPSGTLYTVYIDVPSDSMRPSTSGLRALNVATGKQIWNTSFPTGCATR